MFLELWFGSENWETGKVRKVVCTLVWMMLKNLKFKSLMDFSGDLKLLLTYSCVKMSRSTSKHSIFPSISCLMNDSVQTNLHTNFLREEWLWITALLCRKFKPWIYEILKSTVKSRAYTRVSKYSIFPLISCLMNDSVQTNVHTNFLREDVWITALFCRKVKLWELLTWCFKVHTV